MITRGDVRIENPCGLDFSKMTRSEATKLFCKDCRKQVHDLTLATEVEARGILAQAGEAELCVSYLADARGRLVFIPDVPTAKLTRRKREILAVAAAATIAASVAGCDGPMRMGGAISAPNVPPPALATSYEITRGTARVSITDQPGSFVVEVERAASGANESKTAFITGKCVGDEATCAEARELLGQCKTTEEFVVRLQQAGFSIQQQVHGPNPCAGKRLEPTST